MTSEIVSIITALYSFIAKLIILLENDLDMLSMQKKANRIVDKKNITDTLNKLVTLTNQLKKLAEGEKLQKESEIDEKDKMIIDNFFKDYRA